jgi:hypothetical protein
MRAYLTLRELVRNCGGSLIEEHVDPKAGGSAHAVFQGQSNTRFRFVWDGKENSGFLQPEGGDQKWLGQTAIVRKPTGANFSNLHEFLKTAERLTGELH